LDFVSKKLVAAGFQVLDGQEWRGKTRYLDVGALVYDLKAIPRLVPGFSVDGHLDTLLRLQERLEKDQELAFQSCLFLILARKRSI
jgi:hypothetical protein